MEDPLKRRKYDLQLLLRLDADQRKQLRFLRDRFDRPSPRFGTIWLRMAWELWGEGWYYLGDEQIIKKETH
jgi:hypothetical protein